MIITRLAGQIVVMSQHKFASNVIEKCLQFGGPAQRTLLLSEMLGHTDENEPLQVGVQPACALQSCGAGCRGKSTVSSAAVGCSCSRREGAAAQGGLVGCITNSHRQ